MRTFQENMKTVHAQMPPFKHEFYAIALKLDGSGYAKTGNYSTENLKATVFFNSPYQILHWDIAPDWNGFYIMFSEDFYRRPFHEYRLAERFPYLLLDQTLPLTIDDREARTLEKLFADIFAEFHVDDRRTKDIILSYVHILLLKVARLFEKQAKGLKLGKEERTNDIKTVGRFKTLIEESFRNNGLYESESPHQVQFYALRLNMHPNHLNALIKRITDHTASEIIQKHVLSLAKSRLRNTGLSIKEIAFELHYNYPNHFTIFFKKQLGITPNQYRNSQ
ncbi:MAG: AraC family transcriptional regulator [Bacteroidota bacterium]